MDTTDWESGSLDSIEYCAREIVLWVYHDRLSNPEQTIRSVLPRVVGRGFSSADVEAYFRGTGNVPWRDRISILLLAAHELRMPVASIIEEYLHAIHPHLLTHQKLLRLRQIGKLLERASNHLAETLVH